jgi:heme exporter protein D
MTRIDYVDSIFHCCSSPCIWRDAQRDSVPPRAVFADDGKPVSGKYNAMSLGLYASFIVTSYALVAAVVAILIVWIILDYRRQTERLRKLEASGVVRRSGRSAADIW